MARRLHQGVWLSFLLLLPVPVQAQSIQPGADGTGSTVNQNGNLYTIEGGSLSGDGTNLFHSFARFGLNTGEIANFLSNPAIQNILGRVTGGEASVINGLIQVTGGNSNLYLMNPAGMIFGANASLNVPASFTATTATQIGFGTDRWFNAIAPNTYTSLTGTPTSFAFTLAQPGAMANLGNLAVNPGASITLMGGTVLNTGTLTAPNGQITLTAVPGQKLVRVSQTGSLLNLEFLPLSTTDNLTVPTLPQLLTGGSANNATDAIANSDGSITLSGSLTPIDPSPGSAIVAGRLDTSGTTGGDVTVVGNQVNVMGSAIDASGVNGGGTIRIGGDYQGQATLPGAVTTTISADSILKANALSNGNGGTVIVWSDGTTNVAGTITAQGGSNGGNGGLVETSGQQILTVAPSASVSTLAPRGVPGTWLLDPISITIVQSGGTDTTVAAANANPGASTIDFTVISTALGLGNVTLTASDFITVNTGTALAIPDFRTLALNAPTVNLNAPIAIGPSSTLQGIATVVNVGAGGRIQNGVDVAASGATVNLAAGTFTQGQVNIAKSLTVQGTGAGSTIIDGGGISRGFLLNPGVGNTVNLSGLTIQNTRVTGSLDTGSGGGIRLDSGNLNLSNSTLSRNSTADGALGFGGGGIYNNRGTVTITNSTFTGNTTEGFDGGGGILNVSGTVTITNSAFTGNQATGSFARGGAIYNRSGTVTITDSTISENSSRNPGGGILNFNGTIGITNSTLSGNSTTSNAGGIDNNGGTLTINNSTVSGNSTSGLGGGISSSGILTINNSTISGNSANTGGGIYKSSTSTLSINNSTLTLNTASVKGGGIFNEALSASSSFFLGLTQGPLNLANSIVAGNSSPLGPDLGAGDTGSTFPLLSAALNSQGNNLIGNTSGAVGFISTDRLNVDPLLGPLSNNGGSTQTHALLPGSPAINAGGSGATSADQRGVAAVGIRDIGAFEATPGSTPIIETPIIDTPSCDLIHCATLETGQGDGVLNLERTPEAQLELQQIEAATGVKPALIYLSFVPSGTSVEHAPQVYEQLFSTQIRQYHGKPGEGSPLTIAPSDLDQLEVLLVTTSGKPIRKQIKVSRAEMLAVARQFVREVAAPFKTRTTSYLASSQQLYNWIIRPVEAELQTREIQNLSFITETGLRFIPFAALHDGKGFLIDQYSIGLMPSLNLIDTRYVDIRNSQVLLGGTSTFTDLSPLPAVPTELAAIRQIWGTGTKSLQESNFTPEQLRATRRQQPFGIVHLATHGEFVAGDRRQSFIQFSNIRLELDELRSLGLNQPAVELVVLSACKMALGSDDAELGFAGLALQLGAKTVLASLWSVSDEGTLALMVTFYRSLQQAPIKAEALRRAQQALRHGKISVKDGQLIYADPTGSVSFPLPETLQGLGNRNLAHPYYWAAFTMLGSPW